MRVFALAFALVASACSKSPPIGRYISDAEGLRLYTEGDGLFIEVFTFRTSHAKPTLVSKLEKHDGGGYSANLGLLGRLDVEAWRVT